MPTAAMGQYQRKALAVYGLAVETSNELVREQQRSWQLALEAQGRLIGGLAAADPAAAVSSWLDWSIQVGDMQHLLQRFVRLITDSQRRAVELLSSSVSQVAEVPHGATGHQGASFVERRTTAVVIAFPDRRRSTGGIPAHPAASPKRRTS